jgi:hypothetical protein
VIFLSATPVNSHGAFRFHLEAPGREPLDTTDSAAAARLLQEFGVEDPDRYIAHARQWGSIEIVPTRRG